MSTYAEFSLDEWLAYTQANTEFARTTLDLMTQRCNNNHKRPFLIWIHDYELLTMPLALRRMLDNEQPLLNSSRIVFSLHTPFPTWDVFRLNPWSRDLLAGLLGAHLIVFLNASYAGNFLECCWRVLGAKIDRQDMIVEYDGRNTAVRVMPLGFDYEWFEENSSKITVNDNIGEKIILGIDRLDYTKGLVERIHGYERLLEKYPEVRSKTVLFQVVSPPHSETDATRSLKSRLDREIARICGRFSTPNWTPIRYIHKYLSQKELMDLYACASVGLVAPIRDGASQIAKEFIACCSASSAVLVMSMFSSGAESSINDSAVLLVNPLERDMFADVLKSSLDIDSGERVSKMVSLRASIKRFDVRGWAMAISEAVTIGSFVDPPPPLTKIPPAILVSFVERQINAKSAIERHDQDMIVKSAIKNIV